MLAFEHEDAEIEVMLVSEAPALLKVVARWIVGSMSCLLSVVVFWRVIDGVDGACSFEGVGIQSFGTVIGSGFWLRFDLIHDSIWNFCFI